MLPNKIIEDIARRVAREVMAGGDRAEDILKRKIENIVENQKNLAEGVADMHDELTSVINNPPKSFLTNGAFELDTNNDGVADDWEFGGTADSKSAGMAEAAVYGTKCQRITIGSDNTVAGGTAYIKQTVPINAGRRYTFSVFHKDDGVEQMDYYIMIRKIYADETYADIVIHSESYTDWGHRVSTTFDGDEGVVEAEIYIGISVSEASIGASAWFDMAILNFGAHPIPPIAVVPEIMKREFSDTLFQIVAESDPAPASGKLEDLFTDDLMEGPVFLEAPTITFTFPMSWFFDMVRLYPSADVGFYVQAYDNGEWRSVAGDSSNFQPAIGMETNVVEFDKMIVTNKLRIIFDSPLTLYRLKFWTITFADEILAQVLHITDSMYLSSHDGQLIWDHEGIKMRKPDDVVNRMELAENRIAFRDPLTGEPSIGLGFVHDLAQEIDPEANPDDLIEYGFFMTQGEIRAAQAVLNKSLSDYVVTRKKIEDGSVGMDTVENGSVTLKKLSDALSVTIPDRFQRWDYKEASYLNLLTNPGFETGNLNGWTGNGQIETTYRHSGSYAVYQPLIYQDAPASPGEAWVASAWIRSGAVFYTYLYLYFLSASKEILSTFSTRVAKADPNWVKLTTYGIAPTNTAYARVRIEYPGSEVDVYTDDAELYGPNIPESYQTFMTSTIPQTETCEQIRVIHNLKRLEGDGVFTVRGFVGGIQKYEISAETQEPTITINLDVRGIEGDLDIQIQAKATNASSQWVSCEIMQNQRLPLRGAAPSYAVSNAVASSCSGTCERSCQTTQQLGCKSDCQNTCQNVCQDTCQDPCQGSCQATCEKTSQGGGCFVEGTLVSIYDGEVLEIPIETLEPGMLMPAYDPNTDTIIITECVSNEKSKTGTLFVIEIEGGYTLKATGEQPFDVLRTHNEKPSWYRVPARYLKPGDTMVRPWDEDKTPKVLSVAEITVPPTWVWNPRTVAKRYIVEGFADAFLKM